MNKNISMVFEEKNDVKSSMYLFFVPFHNWSYNCSWAIGHPACHCSSLFHDKDFLKAHKTWMLVNGSLLLFPLFTSFLLATMWLPLWLLLMLSQWCYTAGHAFLSKMKIYKILLKAHQHKCWLSSSTSIGYSPVVPIIY